MAQYINHGFNGAVGNACGDREEFRPSARHRAGEISQFGPDWDSTWHAGIDRVKTRAIMKLRDDRNTRETKG